MILCCGQHFDLFQKVDKIFPLFLFFTLQGLEILPISSGHAA